MFNRNIKIVPGDIIEIPQEHESNSWVFTTLDFSKIDIINLQDNSTSKSIVMKQGSGKVKIKSDYLLSMMREKEAIIVMHPNKVCTEFEKLEEKISKQCYERYKDSPTMIMSPNNDALMSNPIVPIGIAELEQNTYCDNGLVFESNFDDKSSRECKYYTQGFNWTPSFKSNSLIEMAKQDSNSHNLFGDRSCLYPGAGYIDMSTCKNKKYDKGNRTATRVYEVSNMQDSNSKLPAQGACALVYGFVDCDPPIKGDDASPLIIFSLNNIITENAIVFSAGPNGKASARVGSDVSIGEIGGSTGATGKGTDQPPQAEAIGGSTVFAYPLYNGFVFSGSPDTGGMFIKYSDFQAPLNMVKIKSNSKMTDEMKEDFLQNPYSQMQWFPTLVQETQFPDDLSLSLMDEITSKNKFGTKTTILKKLNFINPKLEWWYSTGKFAYCPLFFSPCLSFDLYFKGDSVEKSNSDYLMTNSEYYIYPIGAIGNVGVDEDKLYDNFTNTGAKCLEISDLYINEDDMSNAIQPIYQVHFEYSYSGNTTGNPLPRYPLELFGCVVATKRKKFQFSLRNENGTFSSYSNSLIKDLDYHNQFNVPNSDNSGLYKWMDFITNLTVSCQFQGPNGSFTLDEYAMNRDLKDVRLDQLVGEVDFKVEQVDSYHPTHDYPAAHHQQNKRIPYDQLSTIFKGYALELRNQVSEAGHTIDGTLQGLQKKLSDMKLITAPYWDGDRLEMICQYFEQYCKIKIYMVDNEVETYEDRKEVSYTEPTWVADKRRMIGDSYTSSPDFRVPRSFEYSKPSVDFPTGTSCLEALNKLAEYTSCALVIQPDGTVDFFELNNMGVPYYVKKQFDNDIMVSFGPQEIISLNISPYLENKYNSFVTFALLKKRSKKTNRVQAVTTSPGIVTTFGDNTYPWSRPNVSVENGSLTPSELKYVHANNVLFGISDIYQGQVQVYGNTKVYHLYQAVEICGVKFFVQSIDHQIDLSTKTWTTSYGLTYFNAEGVQYDDEHNELINNNITNM